ncbi:MAG TPA: aldose 1-epimerase family protein [Nocardioidaceae bacterium]|nr:aldose 1-epimerase family protein [Nocardioidaceae bacterium]
MVAPSGEQFEIRGGGYRAVVTECGAGLRLLEHDERPVLAGFAVDEHATGGRGQLLLPWPNRVAGAAYSFGGRDLQLPVTEHETGNAIHGLTRWSPWTLEELAPGSVSLVHRLMAQPGYPWTVDLHVVYDLSADGLTATVTATNLSAEPAPYAQGAHPYLTVGDEGVEGWELTLPADTRLRVDERGIPTGLEQVEGSDMDFRISRPIRGAVLDTCFTDLTRTEDGRATVTLRNPAADRAVAVWMDRAHEWVQVFTGDTLATGARRSVALEPMTAPPNAFGSGEGLVELGAAGEPGDEHSSSWGIHTG